MPRVGVINKDNVEDIRKTILECKMTIQDIADVLGITKNNVYPLVHKWGLPVHGFGVGHGNKFYDPSWDLGKSYIDPDTGVSRSYRPINAHHPELEWVNLENVPLSEKHPRLKTYKELPLVFLVVAEYFTRKLPSWDYIPGFKDKNPHNVDPDNLIVAEVDTSARQKLASFIKKGMKDVG